MKKYALVIPTLLLMLICGQPLAQSPAGILVIRVIDGDTIVIANGQKVRLLGVDTPELHHPNKKVECFAQEAKLFTEAQILNKEVKLTSEGPKQDRYGRLLAWVWYGDDFKKLLNAEIIKEGYGFSYRKYPTSKLEEFNELERQAREQQKGLWHPDACNGQR
jgi:micrococcal nuclease